MNKCTNELEQFIYHICYQKLLAALNEYIASHIATINWGFCSVKYPEIAYVEDMLLEFTRNISIDEDTLSFEAVLSCTVYVEDDDGRSAELSKWFLVSCDALIEDKLKQFKIRSVSNYTAGCFGPSGKIAVSKNIVPILYKKDLDAEAEVFLKKYYPIALEVPTPIPIAEVAESMGLNIVQGYCITNDFSVFGEICFSEGQHEAIIPVEIWEAAQIKKRANAGHREPVEKDHHYVYSALIKCPKCGKSMFGVPMRGRKRKKDGTLYPTYYSYACRSDVHNNGIKCGFGQISCGIIDKAMSSIISQIINVDNFGDIMAKLVNDQIDTTEVEKELDTATKAHRQALGLQRKLESELDKLDVLDKHYDRKYESLSRRLDDTFEVIEEAEKQISDCEARMESIKRQQLTIESVCESLKIFDELFDKMNDYEKKVFVNTFV